MQSTLTLWTLRFVLGIVVLIACGNEMPAQVLAAAFGPGNYALADIVGGAVGFWLSFGAISPIVRCLGEDARLRRDWGAQVHTAFVRSTTPRQVFLLLLAVAEADGRAGADERELVRRFLLQRFVDPVSAADLASWEAERLPPLDLADLARRVARGMNRGERATLFSWACLVAFVDNTFAPAEHAALQRVAAGLGLDSEHARMLFLFARDLHARSRGPRSEPRFRTQHSDAGRAQQQQQQRQQQSQQQRGQRQQRQQQQQQQWRQRPPPPPTPPPAGERARALATLGLTEDATPEAIRRRHRELVRRFHPDAQPNLGPIAQQEATERFRAIQRAYEVLTS